MANLNRRARSTIEQVRARRAMGLARRPRRIPRQLLPNAIEREYARTLIRLVAEVEQALAPLLGQLPGLVAGVQEDRRLDAGEGRRAQQTIEQAAQQLDARISPRSLEEIVARFGQRISAFNRKQLQKQIRAAIGADVFATESGIAAAVDGFVVENVGLIETIPQTLFSQVEGVVTRGLTGGVNVRDLTKQIRDRFAVTRNRARVIARDQIGKLNGQINARRQQNMGVTHFFWRNAGDERVRDAHEINGRRFSYAQGGHTTEGIPGEAIQCRCHAEPDFSAIVGEV